MLTAEVKYPRMHKPTIIRNVRPTTVTTKPPSPRRPSANSLTAQYPASGATKTVGTGTSCRRHDRVPRRTD
jgi:hypothetical protein